MLFSSLLRTLRPPWARTDWQARRQTRRQRGLRLTVEQLEDRRLLSGGLAGNLVVFGDSLSDTGNAALATGGALPNPGLYYQGRFSNGPIWVDTLAKYLGEPAVRPSLAGGLDYAFGGATVAYQNQPPPFNAFPRVSQQVDQYLASHTPSANDLFMVWGGANDFIESFSSPTGPINPILSADTLASSLGTLANSGAREFVVPNLPPLGETPFIRGLGIPGLSAAADQWSAAFDGELAADVANFKSGHPGATVVSLDVAGLYQQGTQPSNPFGFVNTTDAVGPLVPGSVFLSAVTAADPQDYLFFDGVHPTSKTHQLVGLEAAAGVYDVLGVHHLVVTSTADTVDPTASGLSLRERVNLSNAMVGQQTITFALGAGPHQIVLSGKDLPIMQNLIVLGPGAQNLTISGNHASRIFDISGGPTVTIAGLTIANGLADQGGGIDNLGTLTLSHDALSGNEALGDSLFTGIGGGVFNEAGASLTVDHSTFTNNQAVGNVGRGWGGGILNEGSASVTNSTFTGNQSTGGSEPGQPDGTAGVGFGGGIGSIYSATLTVSNSTFTHNKSIDGLGANARAGAIGSGINTSLTVSNSTFAGNQALANSTVAIGGAIDAFDVSDTISNGTFTSNRAIGSRSGALAFGGAIENEASMTVTNCTLTGNEAIGGAGGDGVTTFGFGQGGGIDSSGGASSGNLSVLNSTLTDNLAIGGALAPGAPTNLFTASDGGAMAVAGTLTLADSSLVGNQVIGGAGGAGGAGSAATGGGLEIFGATATIANCLLSDNSAVGGPGGSGAPGGPGVGGGIDVEQSSTAAVTNTTLTDNHALGGTGGSGANGGAGLGGGISVGSAVLFATPDTSSVTLNGSTLDHNTAIGGDGGPGSSGGDGWGGGLVALAGSATISNSSLDHNQAVGGDGDEGGNGGNGFGGGVYIAKGASVSVTHGTISHNRATGGEGDDGGSDGLGVGGGVYNLGVFIFDPTTVIAHNHASTSNDNVFP